MLLLLPLFALAEDPAWHQLRAPAAVATSYLRSGWNRFEENYHPTYVLDGNPATAWTEGVAGLGVGESLSIPVTPQRQIRRLKLRIRNGYQKSAELFGANAAPGTVRVSLLSRTGESVAEFERKLARTLGWQELVWDASAPVDFAAVRLTVRDVSAGRTYQDTCISDVEIFVDAGAGYDASVEAARHALATEWIAARVTKAAYYAKMPKASPFAAGTFTARRDRYDPDAWQKDVDHLRAFRAELDASTAWFRVETVGTTPPIPEGLEFMDPLTDLFSAERGFAEAARPTSVHLEELGYSKPSPGVTNARILWAAPGRPRVALVGVTQGEWHQVGMRGMYEARNAWWTFEFDDSGRPRLALVSQEGQKPGEWQPTLLRFSYDASGRLAEVRVEGEITRVREEDPNYRTAPEFGAIVLSASP